MDGLLRCMRGWGIVYLGGLSSELDGSCTKAKADWDSYYHGMEGMGSTRDELDGFGELMKGCPGQLR